MNTLDKIHTTHTSAIKNNCKKLSALKKKLCEINEKMEFISKNEIKIAELDDLRRKKGVLKVRIKSIEDNSEMFKYYMKTGTLLFQYYDRIENVESAKSIEHQTTPKKDPSLPKTSVSSVISYFKTIENENDNFKSNHNISNHNTCRSDSNIYFDTTEPTKFTLPPPTPTLIASATTTSKPIRILETTATVGISTIPHSALLTKKEIDEVSDVSDVSDASDISDISNVSDASDISETSYISEALCSSKSKNLSEPSDPHRNNKKVPEMDLIQGYFTRESLRNLYLEKMEILDYKKRKHNTCISIRDNEDYSPSLSHFCKECLFEMTCVVTEGIAECPNCGIMENIMIDSDKPSYRDIPKETNSYSYRRSNHFNEWIAQFQAKERTQIPRDIIYQIVDEIKKERIHNLSHIKPCKIRAILKKLKLNKFYEHIPHIINQINGKPPPVISRQTEDRLRGMFNQIQNPFIEFCPKDRKNFLSYSYVLHKFVELLDMTELKALFPLLKSREKLFQCDLIWKQICKKLNWAFYKSI
jgi:hypothetical protein